MIRKRDGKTLLWAGHQGSIERFVDLTVCFMKLSPFSADPLSNISGMLTFDSSEEAVAFAVRNGMYTNIINMVV